MAQKVSIYPDVGSNKYYSVIFNNVSIFQDLPSNAMNVILQVNTRKQDVMIHSLLIRIT